MAQLRIALAQTNPCVGDLEGNAARVLDRAHEAAEAGAHVVLFGEMALTGYPVEDLALRETFVAAARAKLERLAADLERSGCGGIATVVGCLDADEVGVRDAVAVLYGGAVVARQYKYHLPNYGVFDERRYFAPGERLAVVRLHGCDIGMAVCEDLWQPGGPVAALGEAGVDLVLAPNASPYERSKDDVRLPLVAGRAREAGAPVAYCNLVGAQDDLVFDGDSVVVGADGELVARAPRFAEHLLLADLSLPARTRTGGTQQDTHAAGGFTVTREVLAAEPVREYEPDEPLVAEPLSDEAEVWQALVTGLRDYVRKNGFRTLMFGFSGGIDSSVCAALAADAVGPDALHGVSMPSTYSSEHSRTDAAELAERIGCHFRTVPVADMVAQFVGPLGLTGLAEENVQARCRGVTLMALSNQEAHLVLAPGNKTELAVGYSTIYGDAVGGFAPIKDVPKTLVWRLAEWRNAEADKRGETPPIPPSSIAKPPSAELRPGQQDTDSLPPYELLDRILQDYVEGDRGYAAILEAGFDPDVVHRVLRLVDGAEYKRRQYPPGTKVTGKAFGRDRRLPVTSAWREGATD